MPNPAHPLDRDPTNASRTVQSDRQYKESSRDDIASTTSESHEEAARVDVVNKYGPSAVRLKKINSVAQNENTFLHPLRQKPKRSQPEDWKQTREDTLADRAGCESTFKSHL